VTSTTVAHVRIDDERAGPPPSATATNEVENEFRFQHPFTANITGSTGYGKTYFV
jgi:hypothetical protein